MKRIEPGAVAGVLEAPASKSMMQRAVAAAALARGTTVLRHPSLCDDGLAALGVAEALGAEVRREPDALWITGGLRPLGSVLDCGESGLCIRMFAPIAALFEAPLTLEGRGSLARRPVDMVEAPLRALGVEVETCGGRPPLRIRGPLRGGLVTVDGSISSQFLTGLLLALPCAPRDSEIRVERLASLPYVRMTLDLLADFGILVESNPDLAHFRIPGGQAYGAREFGIEGDWSGAAFLLVAGALAGRVGLRGLRMDSLQADRAVLEALEAAGAKLEIGAGRVAAARGDLRAFDFDATQCPDLFPPLAALASACPGITTLHGARRLAHKESDRAAALQGEFARLGVQIEVEGDRMRIHGGGDIPGGEVDARGDHRIAMAAATLALVSRQGVAIHGEQCVAKSFPDFYDRLEEVRA